MLQKHRDDPKRIKIIFKHAELMGSELFANDQWFSDSETNLVDNVSNIIVTGFGFHTQLSVIIEMPILIIVRYIWHEASCMKFFTNM